MSSSSFNNLVMTTEASTPTPTLYLIPVPLAEVGHDSCLPPRNRHIVRELRHFIVENVRSARRFLKAADRSIDIDALTFYELNKRTSPTELTTFLEPLGRGCSVGVISEAGCPAVADPGSEVVALAQERGYRVEPLVGPSSILMVLMASGFNGQRFTFLGYLPIEASARVRAIREAEQRALQLGETQIFIETPYRNVPLVEELMRQCRGTTKLCIARGLSSPDALIETRSMKQWQGRLPQLHKVPTIFALGR